MGGRTGKQRRRRSCQISAKEGVCPEHFFFCGIWKRLENVFSAMETGASVAASSATTLGHPDTQTVRRSGWQVWMLHLPPSSPVAERTLANVEKAKQIYGKINITEDLAQRLWHTDTHEETKTYYSHCRDTEIHKTCATGAHRRFVSGGGQWSGACRPPDTKEDHLPTIVRPETHLHPHLKVDILRQWPKPHLTHKITGTWTSYATEQPE